VPASGHRLGPKTLGERDQRLADVFGERSYRVLPSGHTIMIVEVMMMVNVIGATACDKSTRRDS
jgi:hypothetical protein